MAGRPKRWATKEALQADLDKYWNYCEEKEKPPTIAGLAYYLNVDRQTIYNYSKNDEYFDTIKKAREYVMMSLEETAIIKGNAGTIFVMKQYGYTDKQEVETNIKSNEFVDALTRFANKV
jgi:hypothetical protein